MYQSILVEASLPQSFANRATSADQDEKRGIADRERDDDDSGHSGEGTNHN
jgi:hypothetical protein